MKKLVIFVTAIALSFVLYLGVLSIAVPYLGTPQKAEATGILTLDLSNELNWILNFINQAKEYALEAKKYEQMITDYAQFTQQTIQLVQGNKTAAGLACYAEQNLGVNVRGILGQYGLGGATAITDKILGGAGIKDLVCDEIGGCIGAGGILSGGLSGLYSRTDLVSSTIEQFGVRIPSGIVDKLDSWGAIDKQNIARAFAGKECPCVNGVCPPDPIKTPAGQSSCYNPNNPSIINKTKGNIKTIKGSPQYNPDPASGTMGISTSRSVLGDTAPVPNPGNTDTPFQNCTKRVPPVSNEDMARILWVLEREGKSLSKEEAAKLIESGAFIPEEILKRYIPNPGEVNSVTTQDPNSTPPPNQEDVEGRPPCAEWGTGEDEGKCMKLKILF